ncbi:unnamed protein product [Paramecium primaurelia]|uniref:Uncharacterized protein n=1 Tax=Paramecium primaurelia TaxID=5886 RepID=A0A8S1L3F7_PARPR|nr:unnamed protein product [Paramecium primaurelia]
MLTNSRSNPTIKPVLKLKHFLNTIVVPYSSKDPIYSLKNSIESSRFASYHNIGNSVRKNIIKNQHSFLPCITKRKSLIIEANQISTITFDHVQQEQNNNKQMKKHLRQLKNLSIAQNSNDNLNSTYEELQILQSNKNSPTKYKTSNKQEQQKSRKQKLVKIKAYNLHNYYKKNNQNSKLYFLPLQLKNIKNFNFEILFVLLLFFQSQCQTIQKFNQKQKSYFKQSNTQSPYKLMIIYSLNNLYIRYIELQSKYELQIWKNTYTIDYIKELTCKTGNPKKFNVFIFMLQIALQKSNENVLFDILNYQYLENLKQQKQQDQSQEVHQQIPKLIKDI